MRYRGSLRARCPVAMSFPTSVRVTRAVITSLDCLNRGSDRLRHWLEETGRQGTIRLYGTPAEEGGSGKVYMVRAVCSMT